MKERWVVVVVRGESCEGVWEGEILGEVEVGGVGGGDIGKGGGKEVRGGRGVILGEGVGGSERWEKGRGGRWEGVILGEGMVGK